MKKIILLIVTLGVWLGAAAQIDSLRLDEVVVTGTRYATDVRHLPMTVTTVNRGALTSQYRQNVLPTLMEQVPGLLLTSRSMMGYGVSTGAAGGLSLRGLTGGSGQLMVLIDGHPQYQGIYGHPISDSYQTLMAERVEVLRGPASLLYGSNAMGGVINIVTRRMENDGVRTRVDIGAGSYGTVEAEATNQLRYGRFSSTISGRYGRTDNHRPRMGFEQYGGDVKLGYDFSAHWSASLAFDMTHFNASYPGSVDAPVFGARQWITRGMAGLSVSNSYDRTSGAVSVYSNFGRHKIDDGSSDPDKPTARYFRSKDALTGVSVYQSVRLFEGNRVTLGFDYQNIYGNAYYTSKESGEVLETPNKQSARSTRTELAGYIDVRQEITSWMTLDAGVRIDHHSVTGTEWIPQAGLVFRPVAGGEIKAMVAKGFRNPTMRELYLYPPSNEELRPERLWNYELSWRHRVGAVIYGLNLFYLDCDNMIQTIERKNVNTGELKNYGVELEATYRVNDKVTLTTNHALLHMKHHVVSAPVYKGYLAASYRWNRLAATLGVQYVGGLYTAVGEHETKENFCLVNATVSYRVLDWLTLWARGENLLAQRYEYLAGYPLPLATAMAGVSIQF